MKIQISGSDGKNSFSQRKAIVKAYGDRSLLIPLLERALEVAREGRYDTDVKETVEKILNQ